ncbi:MAG TPA: hypothetical protein VFD40_01535 [Candidatus Paceibacterota bacterium]|nr:hypothetical protein [Candidatus Paceibacterota bacterium]
MKKSVKYLLDIIFNAAIIISLFLIVFGFFSKLLQGNEIRLIIILLCILTVQVLKSVSEMDKKKDKN